MTVPDAERILEAWMVERKTRDLHGVSAAIGEGLSWTMTSPCPKLMASYADVAERFAIVAPNLTVGHALVVAALISCNSRCACLAAPYQAEELSGWLRCLLTRYRNLKQYPERLEAISRKAF